MKKNTLNTNIIIQAYKIGARKQIAHLEREKYLQKNDFYLRNIFKTFGDDIRLNFFHINTSSKLNHILSFFHMAWNSIQPIAPRYLNYIENIQFENFITIDSNLTYSANQFVTHILLSLTYIHKNDKILECFAYKSAPFINKSMFKNNDLYNENDQKILKKYYDYVSKIKCIKYKSPNNISSISFVNEYNEFMKQYHKNNFKIRKLHHNYDSLLKQPKFLNIYNELYKIINQSTNSELNSFILKYLQLKTFVLQKDDIIDDPRLYKYREINFLSNTIINLDFSFQNAVPDSAYISLVNIYKNKNIPITYDNSLYESHDKSRIEQIIKKIKTFQNNRELYEKLSQSLPEQNKQTTKTNKI